MSRSSLFVLASFVIVVGLARPCQGQAPAKKFATADGKRPGGLFAPGGEGRQDPLYLGERRLSPQGRIPRKGRELPGRNPQDAPVGRPRHEKHVVKSFVYLEDPDKYAEMNKYYGEVLPRRPAGADTLGVAQVPGPSRLEITCIAYTDLAERSGSATPGRLPL